MADIESELREQFIVAVRPAEFPVESRSDVVEALPNGMQTQFEAGDFSMSAIKIATRLYEYQDFPYEKPEALADDLLNGLKDENII